MSIKGHETGGLCAHKPQALNREDDVRRKIEMLKWKPAEGAQTKNGLYYIISKKAFMNATIFIKTQVGLKNKFVLMNSSWMRPIVTFCVWTSDPFGPILFNCFWFINSLVLPVLFWNHFLCLSEVNIQFPVPVFSLFPSSSFMKSLFPPIPFCCLQCSHPSNVTNKLFLVFSFWFVLRFMPCGFVKFTIFFFKAGYLGWLQFLHYVAIND